MESAPESRPRFEWAIAALSAMAFCLLVYSLTHHPQPFGLKAPPDLLVGFVWTVLLSLFGVALLTLPREANTERTLVGLLIVSCLAYPFYTGGLDDPRIGLIGNLATLALGIGTVFWLVVRRRRVGLLVAPVIPWLVYASWTLSGSGS